MPRYHMSTYQVDVPDGWAVGADEEDQTLDAIVPPDSGGARVFVSAYSAPPNHTPTADELWEFVEESVAGWGSTPSDIRQDRDGFALDVRGDTAEATGIVAARLWPGTLVFASYYYEPNDPDDVSQLPVVEQVFASLAPISI